jgi:hypothetical protein
VSRFIKALLKKKKKKKIKTDENLPMRMCKLGIGMFVIDEDQD